MCTTQISQHSTTVNRLKSIRRLLSIAFVSVASFMVFWSLTFGGFVILGAYLNDRARTFDNTHAYKPDSGAYRQVKLHATGDIESGGDSVVSNSLITISITTNDAQTFVKRQRYSDDALLRRDETYVRVGATPSALAAWIKSLPIPIDEETLRSEAKELSTIIFNTCNAYSPSWELKHFSLMNE
jgi:hypothetical protein